MRLLVAEDDQRTADYLVGGLTESGHIVDRVADGDAALAMAIEGIYDALVLDRKLPGIDGVAVVRRLRVRDRRTPVLMLSGVATTPDRVEGLRAGCDDYLSKPYSFSELLARLEALGRRTDSSRRRTTLRVGDLELDTQSRTVARAGRIINLQRRELLLLELLLRRAGEVVTRSMLLEAAWTYDFDARGNLVDMHIHRLRQKIDEGFVCIPCRARVTPFASPTKRRPRAESSTGVKSISSSGERQSILQAEIAPHEPSCRRPT